VDDDENILTSVSMFLESEGYEVRKFHDGVTALEALKASPPDLAVFDVKMPRMDGLELLRRLRQTSNLPVIFLTSKDDEFDEAIGFNMGADDYITKPFSQRLLGERIKAVLRRARLTNIELPEPQEGDDKVILLARPREVNLLAGTAMTKPPKAKTPKRRRRNRRRGARRSLWTSRLTRNIFLSNLIGLIILVSGALAMNRFEAGLINAKVDNLQSLASTITNVIGEQATGYGGAAELDVDGARQVLRSVNVQEGWRVRLHNRDSQVIADTGLMTSCTIYRGGARAETPYAVI